MLSTHQIACLGQAAYNADMDEEDTDWLSAVCEGDSFGFDDLGVLFEILECVQDRSSESFEMVPRNKSVVFRYTQGDESGLFGSHAHEAFWSSGWVDPYPVVAKEQIISKYVREEE